MSQRTQQLTIRGCGIAIDLVDPASARGDEISYKMPSAAEQQRWAELDGVDAPPRSEAYVQFGISGKAEDKMSRRGKLEDIRQHREFVNALFSTEGISHLPLGKRALVLEGETKLWLLI